MIAPVKDTSVFVIICVEKITKMNYALLAKKI